MRALVGFAAVGLLLTADPSLSESPSEMTALRVPGFALPRPLPLQPFRLVDQHGREFTRADLRNRWTLLFFGYTHCPDVCPTTLAQLRIVRSLLSQQATSAMPAIVFVSIDPQRDTAAQLKQFSARFGPDFTGVGGDPRTIDAFAQQFRVKHAIAGGTSTSYVIDHTSSIALIDPSAQLHVLFSAPLRPEAVAAEIQRLTKASAKEP